MWSIVGTAYSLPLAVRTANGTNGVISKGVRISPVISGPNYPSTAFEASYPESLYALLINPVRFIHLAPNRLQHATHHHIVLQNPRRLRFDDTRRDPHVQSLDQKGRFKS